MRKLFVALLLVAGAASAQTFTPSIPDVEVTTHEGKRVHFYSDLVKGRVVAVNFIYTNCSTICPASGAFFAALQKQTTGVQFISVSIDPATDTPPRLDAWRKRFNARSGWTLVTGTQDSVDRIARAFGVTVARPQDHIPLTIIGSDRTHRWSRMYGFPGADALAEVIAP